MANGELNITQTDPKRASLIEAISELDDEKALKAVEVLLAAPDSGRLVLLAALEGLKNVGRRYEAGEYYVSALVMAGEIMRQIVDTVTETTPLFESTSECFGSVVLGTIEGDIHDLGKDLAKEVLLCHGFKIHDLGVDVAPEVFLAKAIELQPDIVGISVLISTSMPAMTRAVDHLKTMMPGGYRRPGVVVGGGALDQLFFEHTKADIWCQDIMDLPRLCLDWINQRPGPGRKS
jgi:methanogenic corrinoid protein MtbC1